MYLSIERGGEEKVKMGKTSICVCACTGARAVWKAGLVKHGKRSLQSWEEKEKIEEKEERNHSHKTAIQAPSAA